MEDGSLHNLHEHVKETKQIRETAVQEPIS